MSTTLTFRSSSQWTGFGMSNPSVSRFEILVETDLDCGQNKDDVE